MVLPAARLLRAVYQHWSTIFMRVCRIVQSYLGRLLFRIRHEAQSLGHRVVSDAKLGL